MHAVMTFFVGVMGSGYLLPSFVPTRTGRDFRKATAHLDGLFHEIIRRARARASRDQEARPACLLDALIAARNEDGAALTEAELRDECVTLLLAGHETTALTLTYALFLVGTRPELCEVLNAEAAGLPGDGALSPADVRKLELAARVVKEAMRLYPPAWMIGREAN
jgi:cytochrome P450